MNGWFIITKFSLIFLLSFNLAIQAQCGSYDEGTAGDYGYVNTKGEWIIKPQFYHAYDFSDGLATVLIGKRHDLKFAVIDRSGDYVIEPQTRFISSFSEGLARSRIGELGDLKYGFIDKAGEFVIEPKFRNVEDFSEGLAAVKTGGPHSCPN